MEFCSFSVMSRKKDTGNIMIKQYDDDDDNDDSGEDDDDGDGEQ